MYILYIERSCPFCHKVLNFMSANGINADIRDRDTGNHESELVSRGGRRQVPYLVDTEAGVEMYESDDIIAHLNKALVK